MTSKHLNFGPVRIPTPASNPGPLAERAMYGFVVYIASIVLFATYLIWALVPHEWLGLIGITYLPHRHWAITGPFLLVSFTLLCFLGYILHHWSVLLPLTSIYLIRDDCVGCQDELPPVSENRQPIHFESVTPPAQVIPPIFDLDPVRVTERLYLRPR
ncbi:hypothetical protein T265_06103 [Opisthorchis viverrini]|uniref:PIG-P domain-containing protein n=2 Tax=Opisthorchis viverrini TaxID=6198 RepID=A0A074ZHG2_OPIVI|nr:hypothetical protein T265_06103 [Opisthorchis viverrini]KER26668.1 hypothetical protein T265_06103 [Opisthorchis viverrini]